jgi:hypothetical protein
MGHGMGRRSMEEWYVMGVLCCWWWKSGSLISAAGGPALLTLREAGTVGGQFGRGGSSDFRGELATVLNVADYVLYYRTELPPV